MAEKVLNTRIQLKYDTYANWHEKNTVLKKGEIAIVEIAAAQGAVSQVPAIMMKVGNGTSTFDQLPWSKALSADVYDWAKAATKPEYDASEIKNLSTYISGQIEDTDTQYKLEQDASDGHILKFYTKTKNGDWGTPTTITIPDNDHTYTLTTGATKGTVNFNGTEVKVSQLADAAYTTVEALNDTAKGYVTEARNEMTGDSTNAMTAVTLYGIRNLAQNAKNTADAAMPKAGGTFTGSVTLAGDPTANLHAATKQYVDTKTAGLTGAMHFRGTSTTDPTVGPTVTGVTSWAAGDVVLYGSKEFVYDGKTWKELGDEGSHVLKTQTINGKPLEGNITLTAADVGADATGTASNLVNALDLSAVGGTGKYITTISQSNGQVSATAATFPTSMKNPNALTFGSKTYDGSAAQSITLDDLIGADTLVFNCGGAV